MTWMGTTEDALSNAADPHRQRGEDSRQDAASFSDNLAGRSDDYVDDEEGKLCPRNREGRGRRMGELRGLLLYALMERERANRGRDCFDVNPLLDPPQTSKINLTEELPHWRVSNRFGSPSHSLVRLKKSLSNRWMLKMGILGSVCLLKCFKCIRS